MLRPAAKSRAWPFALAGARTSSTAAALAVAAACLAGCSGQSCTDAASNDESADAANVVVFNNVRLMSSGPVADDAVFGEVVGEVRCELAASDEPENGGATFVDAGDALHRVGDRPTTEAVGAYVNREPHVFVAEQEMRERLAGRCTVPVTQACPP